MCLISIVKDLSVGSDIYYHDYHDDSDVLQALDNLWAAIKGNNTKITDDVLITLLKTMCKSAGIKCNDWNDSRFTRVFKV